MTDLMEGARGSKKLKNVVVPDGAKSILKPKKVEGSGKVLHDWKDLFGGTIKRDAIDEIEDGDKRKAIDLVEMLRRPEQYASGKKHGALIRRAVKKVVDTADKELSDMGRGAKKEAGFTKKKFKDAIDGAIKGMGMADMESAVADIEGGKFSLKKADWGIGKAGKDLSKAWSSAFGGKEYGKGLQKDERVAKAAKKARLTPEQLAEKRKEQGRRLAEANKQRAAKKTQKKKGKEVARKEREDMAREDVRIDFGGIDFGDDDDEIAQAVRAGSRIKDPLAWATTKVPNKCGSAEQRAEAREAAQTLQRCPANDERRNVRSDKIKEWEARIRADERDKLEGRGLYAGFPRGSGFIQPTGGSMYGGSIGARLAAPTNIGAGGNLLSPFAPSKRPQAAFANFHMLQQMPVVYQPKGMFSSK